jgi:UDP-N-acetylmuramoyl-tripeptide--D-alanyl-D-alanine ligase
MENDQLLMLHKLLTKGHLICTDSRSAEPGAIFFALKGESFNGNLFAHKALEKGCVAAVVDEPVELMGENIIMVGNVLETLQQLSHFHRKLFNLPVIGITGSNGKTTTKELMHAVLASTFNTLATKGNLNNHIGVPLTLLGLKPEHEIAIIEMGANKMGEIAMLSALACPNFGLITNIGKAHLEGFGSLENIIKTKTELYSHVKDESGLLFVSTDNALLREKSKGNKVIFYGKHNESHCSASIISDMPFVSIAFQVNKTLGKALPGIKGTIRTQLVGVYNFENILAALTIGLYFGVSPQKAINAIETYMPSNSRSQLIKNDRNTILLDAYNANPTSMAAAIENFAGFGNCPRAVMLGDMLEMGNSSAEEHNRILSLLKEKQFELIILIGPEFKAVAKPGKNLLIFDTSSAATKWLLKNPLKGYNVLIKGSRGIQMEKVLESL